MSLIRSTAATLCLAAGILSPTGAALAQTGTSLFEVRTSDGSELLRVADDGGLVAGGLADNGAIPATGPGVRLMWYPAKWAFRAGTVQGSQWDLAEIGTGSVAMGQNTTATGSHSVALNFGTKAQGGHSIAGGSQSIAAGRNALAIGDRTDASGAGAVALGVMTVATGDASTAMGYATRAEGLNSVAMGEEARAGDRALAVGYRAHAAGDGSFALGHQATASGLLSIALGTKVHAQGNGSFVFGDLNDAFPVVAGPNEFLVRAFGGIGLNTGVNIGCDLPKGTGAWSCTSSKLAKEGFEDVDGEDVLARLREVPIQRWRYTGTEAQHIGPFAEDFHAAFGLGESPEKIAQVDADGIALAAVQALERRTAALQAELDALRERMTALTGEASTTTTKGGR